MIVTLSAAKSDLSRLIEKIERGQEAEIIITRNRVPVVRLTQLKESSTMPLIPRQGCKGLRAQAREKAAGARRQGARSAAYALVREHRSDAGDEADAALSRDLGMRRIGVAKGKFELPESTDTDNPKVARLFLKGRG